MQFLSWKLKTALVHFVSLVINTGDFDGDNHQIFAPHPHDPAPHPHDPDFTADEHIRAVKERIGFYRGIARVPG